LNKYDEVGEPDSLVLWKSGIMGSPVIFELKSAKNSKVDFAELERHGVNAKFYAASPCKADLIVKRKSCLCREATYDADGTVVCKRALVDLGSVLNIESPQELQRLAVFPVDTACTKLISSS